MNRKKFGFWPGFIDGLTMGPLWRWIKEKHTQSVLKSIRRIEAEESNRATLMRMAMQISHFRQAEELLLKQRNEMIREAHDLRERLSVAESHAADLEAMLKAAKRNG